METDPQQVVVENNEEKDRFQVAVDGHLAVALYKREGDRIVFTHTEVPKELSGRGIGNKLAITALEFAKAEHLRVIPKCPFIAAYIKRHPEYQDLVDPAFRRKLMQA